MEGGRRGREGGRGGERNYETLLNSPLPFSRGEGVWMEYTQFVKAFRQVSIYSHHVLEDFRPHPSPYRCLHVFQSPSSFAHRETYCDLSVSLQFPSIPVCVTRAREAGPRVWSQGGRPESVEPGRQA